MINSDNVLLILIETMVLTRNKNNHHQILLLIWSSDLCVKLTSPNFWLTKCLVQCELTCAAVILSGKARCYEKWKI